MLNFKTKRVGTLAPLFSLNSKADRTGTLYSAIKFCHWLKETHQTAWQLLPLHQTHLQTGSTTVRVPSPYRGYGIGLNPTLYSSMLDSDYSVEFKDRFIRQNPWLSTYCLFNVLSDHFLTDDWTKWPEKYRQINQKSKIKYQNDFRDGINFYQNQQLVLHYQLQKVRALTAQFNILLIGDMPFYLPLQSPLVWANQSCFDLKSNGTPQKVSGLPDGPKAHFGRQVWGHPLYNWQEKIQHKNILAIWKLRLKYLSTTFGLIRLDHSKGFFNYGAIDPIANKDTMLPGPGAPALENLIKYSQRQSIDLYAEDTGENLAPLRQVLKSHKIPGIRIFRFALTTKGQAKINPEYAYPADYPITSIAYTTTHDTEPLLAFLSELTLNQRSSLSIALGINTSPNLTNLAIFIRQAVVESPSFITLIPIQDWLLSADRINIPGTEKPVADPNWSYVLKVPVENLPTKL